MILTGTEIEREVRNGAITISPFVPEQINPNSYNYRISCNIKISAATEPLDPKHHALWTEVSIPQEGLVLEPKRLYLGCTEEIIGSSQYVVSLIGRSSLGRLGMFLQLAADLGNLGHAHRWTLEIKVVQRLRIYPKMRIGQVSFWITKGDRTIYNGRYTNWGVPVGNLHSTTDLSPLS